MVGDGHKWFDWPLFANSPERSFGLAVMPESSQGEVVNVDPDVSSPVRLIPRVVFHLVEGV